MFFISKNPIPIDYPENPRTHRPDIMEYNQIGFRDLVQFSRPVNDPKILAIFITSIHNSIKKQRTFNICYDNFFYYIRYFVPVPGSNYKLRISVHPNDLERAFNILFSGPLFEPRDFNNALKSFKIYVCRLSSNAKSSERRFYYGTQFTLYLHPIIRTELLEELNADIRQGQLHAKPERIQLIEKLSGIRELIASITHVLESNGIRAGIIPDSDVPISQYVSGRYQGETYVSASELSRDSNLNDQNKERFMVFKSLIFHSVI